MKKQFRTINYSNDMRDDKFNKLHVPKPTQGEVFDDRLYLADASKVYWLFLGLTTGFLLGLIF